MPPNDLNNPLRDRTGPARTSSGRRRPVVAPTLIAAGLVAAIIAGFWIAVVDDPDGGQAVAVATIKDPSKEEPATTGSIASRPAGVEAGTPVQEAALAGRSMARVPAGPPPEELIELSAFGPLPRIGPDGRRPLEAYSRAANLAAGDARPRVAIVVGGLGMSQTGTEQAIRVLPEDITLAFAPYGASLQRWVDKARMEGHEVFLQLPLEPFGYPDQNPGQHTLLASPDPALYADDLAWNLGRMTSYAGVMNYMGGRFTEDPATVAPFLSTIAERGLLYLDDGSSPQSVALDVGRSLGAPVAGADIVLDAERSAAAIERSLAALEVMARERGSAIGVASAFPLSTATIARWARQAADRGILLVPVSAAAAAHESRS